VTVATEEKVLSSTPGMLPLFARAGAAMIPGASKLPFLGGERFDEVPELALKLEQVEIDRERLAAYTRVTKFPLRDQLPPTYPHILAFPLHLALMTDRRFPFPALGLVHIANEIVQHRPIRVTELLDVSAHATPLERHPRGRQFTLRTEITADGEPVWEEGSTILKRGEATGESLARSPEHDAPPELPVTATWRLPGDLGRRYASVSGDMNPIHMHSLSAKAFGFPTAIAHGMWTLARCLAAVDTELPEAFTVSAAFKRPILLPATVTFAETREGNELRFGVRDAKRDTPHLDGAVSL
jgi:acyl dehydratase